PSAAYTIWCRAMGRLPSKPAQTMTASKCWPSPSTLTCSQASPSRMYWRTRSGVGNSDISSAPQLVAAFQQSQCKGGQRQEDPADDRQAVPGRGVGHAEESVAETVDGIEDGIPVRHGLPERWQRLD